MILVALNKVSSLHQPSKLLFRCLAVKDILGRSRFASTARTLFGVCCEDERGMG